MKVLHIKCVHVVELVIHRNACLVVYLWWGCGFCDGCVYVMGLFLFVFSEGSEEEGSEGEMLSEVGQGGGEEEEDLEEAGTGNDSMSLKAELLKVSS